MRQSVTSIPDDGYQTARTPLVGGFSRSRPVSTMALRDTNINAYQPGQSFEYQVPPVETEQIPRKRQWMNEETVPHSASAHKRRAGGSPVEVINLIDDDDDPPGPHANPRVPSALNANRRSSDPKSQRAYEALGSHTTPYEIPSSPSPEPPMTTEPNMPDLTKFVHVTRTPTKATNSSDDIVPITEPVLCQEQADLVDLIMSGRNVFYTGSAGCGKSTVLKSFVKRFAEMGLRVNIIAPTGRAALDINGTTTWSYAGWTPDHHKKPLKALKAGAHGKFVRQRLSDTHVLVIDEISMVENLHFERLNIIMKEARNSDLAYV
ncbi:hypothetical protein K505DRAFT_93473 [Melanomma pulvis-pyrius CBS 109.77]|uniref:ATP-dependent DNA helicase n=1 Tax=Melanomma pulvis-pyrius CBS 109.77 TaxID=1314802 RepID=A0A6A6WZX3_9PLEO|nr:hypothetical protein K505DRAFT_93473 [Melanomma pulvis-pyrius CBS 109.77]